MSEVGTRYERPKNPALKAVQARPLEYNNRSGSLRNRFSRRLLVPLGLAAIFGVGAGIYQAVQHTGDQSRPGETQPYRQQNPWEELIVKKFGKEVPLDEGERIVEKMIVAERDDRATEYIDGEIRLTDTVEVYDYPAPYNPASGEPVLPIGRVKLGTELGNVLMTKGIEIDYAPGATNGPEPLEATYGAFRVGDMQIIGRDGNPIETNSSKIVAISGKFLAPVTPAAHTPNG